MLINTIGYEGARPDDFIRTLQVAQVSMVIDIRDRAQSRRPGFSKSLLQRSLNEVGIEYVHLRELGDPKEGRDAARAHDIAKFRLIFSRVLETEEAQSALHRIIEESSAKSICLLCYERDQTHCHRKLVADRIEVMTGKRARHLGVREFEQDRKRA